MPSHYTNIYFESEEVKSNLNPVYIDDVELLAFPWDYTIAVEDYCGSSTSTIVNLYTDDGKQISLLRPSISP